MVGDVALVLGLRSVALAVASDMLERPWASARHEQKRHERAHRLEGSERLAQIARAALRPARHEIEQSPVPEIDPTRRPEVRERRHIGRLDQPGDRAFIGEGDGELISRPAGGNGRSVPEAKCESELQPAMDVLKQRLQGCETGFGPIHVHKCPSAKDATAEGSYTISGNARMDSPSTGGITASRILGHDRKRTSAMDKGGPVVRAAVLDDLDAITRLEYEFVSGRSGLPPFVALFPDRAPSARARCDHR